MTVARLHHVGVVVEGLDVPTRGFEELLGLPTASVERYGDELDIAFVPCGDSLVEFLTPLRPEGQNADWLRRHGPGIQHLAFEVSDLDVTLASLRRRGVAVVGDAPRPGAGGTRIAFLDPARFGGVMVELCETAR